MVNYAPLPGGISHFLENVWSNPEFSALFDGPSYFYDQWINHDIDKSRVLVVPYDGLKKDLMGVFDRVVKFTGIEPRKALCAAVKRQAEKQKNYQRVHKVESLEDFGIDSRRLKNDFAFLYEKVPYFEEVAAGQRN